MSYCQQHLFSFWIGFVLIIESKKYSNGFSTSCKDILTLNQCQSYYRIGTCKARSKDMEVLCKRTCGFCSDCRNLLTDKKCHMLQKHYACQRNHHRMKVFCPETCGFCPVHCVDESSSCNEQMLAGKCLLQPEEMRKTCKNTCRMCDALTPCDKVKCPVGHLCRLSIDMKPQCYCDSRCKQSFLTGEACGSNGITYKSLCHLKRDECRTMQQINVHNYGKCEREICADSSRESKSGLCAAWKKYGACSSHKAMMSKYCKKTCGICRQDQVPKKPCSFTKYGCCWDDTVKLDSEGRNCRACKDGRYCPHFIDQCGTQRNVAVMRLQCPRSCKYCTPSNSQTSNPITTV